MTIIYVNAAYCYKPSNNNNNNKWSK